MRGVSFQREGYYLGRDPWYRTYLMKISTPRQLSWIPLHIGPGQKRHNEDDPLDRVGITMGRSSMPYNLV